MKKLSLILFALIIGTPAYGEGINYNLLSNMGNAYLEGAMKAQQIQNMRQQQLLMEQQRRLLELEEQKKIKTMEEEENAQNNKIREWFFLLNISQLRELRKEIENKYSKQSEAYQALIPMIEKRILELENIKKNFDENIKPKIVRVHPDFENILQDKTYWDWAAQQRPELKHAALEAIDPAEIIWAIYEYKKYISKQTPVSPTVKAIPIEYK